MNKYYLGIDTSAYTTSLAVIDNRGRIVLDLRKNLEVGSGEKGLRQQEAVFKHVNNLPALIEILTKELEVSNIEVISSTSKPRNNSDSYMPVFAVGKGQAFILSKILACDYMEFSHQEGHIASGLLGKVDEIDDDFLSLHISGGTTELLKVNKNKKNGFEINLIGGSLDLNFGQLIDRIGVESGLEFPSGKEMDDMAQCAKVLDLSLPIKIKDETWFNISGLENYFKDLMKSGNYRLEYIFKTLFYTISLFLYEVIINSSLEYKIKDVLLSGGVAANSIIRKSLIHRFEGQDIDLYFPKTELSSDNAVGIAYLGKRNRENLR